MYHFLKGKVDEVGKDFIILNVNNVGYFIFLATMKKFNTNEEVKLFIHICWNIIIKNFKILKLIFKKLLTYI